MAQKDKIRADLVNTGLIELKFSADVPLNFLVKGIDPNIDPPGCAPIRGAQCAKPYCAWGPPNQGPTGGSMFGSIPLTENLVI